MDNAIYRRINTISMGKLGRIRPGTPNQFGVIDAKGEARMTLKNMKQGRRSMTEYWNEFRLVAS